MPILTFLRRWRWLVALAALCGAGRLNADPGAATPTMVIAGRATLPVSFDQLASFNYPLPGEVLENKPEIPSAIRALDQQRVAITGFLLPVQFENGLTRQAILLRSQMSCCYGAAPMFTEFVLVTVAGDGIRAIMDVPITLVGTFKVGETYEDGYLVGIYQLEGEAIVETPR